MKKVLILAYDFPPYVSVGGLRPYNWFKYLHEYGIYPIIITRQWNNKHGNQLDYISASESSYICIESTESGTIIRTPYRPNMANRLMLKYGSSRFILLRKAISFYYEFMQFIFSVGPKAEIYSAAADYLSKNSVDAIVATGDPFILFRYASKLSKKHYIPWIADYRDIWSQNLHIQNIYLLKKWHSFLEHKIVSTASVITTVSEFLEFKITELINNKKVYILPNGYDPQAIQNISLIEQQTKELSIAFVGSIYDWHPLDSFFKVLSTFISNRPDAKIRVNFYGVNLYGVTFNGDLKDIIKHKFPSLINYITVHKKTPNTELLKELAKQNVMLLFNYYSYMGTKIFDYIGIKRAILFCYTNDSEATSLKQKYFDISEPEHVNTHLQEDLIRQTNSGYLVKDSFHLYEILELLYDEFLKHGKIKCNTIDSEKYSRKHQVQELAEIINNVSLTNEMRPSNTLNV